MRERASTPASGAPTRRGSAAAALLHLPLALLFLPACDSGEPVSGPPVDGEDPASAFDEEGIWVEAAPLPEAVYDPAAAAYRDAVYVVGGLTEERTSTPAVQRYDPSADAWTRLSDFPTSIAQADLVVHRDTLFLLGGNVGSETDPVPRAEVHRYEPGADAWHEHSVLPDRRDEHGGASIGGRIVVFGGGGLTPPPGDSIAVYGTDGEWTYGPPPPHATTGLEVFGALDESVLALEQASSAALDVLAADAEGWSSMLSTPLSEFPRAGTTWKGRLHVLSHSGPERFHRVFDPATETWLRLPPMEEAVRDAVAVAAAGRLYVIGGLTREGTITDDVRAFSQP